MCISKASFIKVLLKYPFSLLLMLVLIFQLGLLLVPLEVQAAGESSLWKLSAANNNTAEGYGANIGRSVTTFGGTGAINPAFSSWAGKNYLYVHTNNWIAGNGTKGYKIVVDTQKFSNITVSYALASDDKNGTDIGPRDFKFQYSLDDVTYHDISEDSVTGNGWDGVVTRTNLPLPPTCENTDAIYLRWLMVSDTGVNGKTITEAGEVNLANIDVKGIAMPVAPSDISLSKNNVLPNSPAGTTIGTFTVTDFNASDTHTLSLVEGEGSTDNALFAITGDILKTAAVMGQGTYTIRVNANDGTYDFAKKFIIVSDIVYPNINGGDQTWDYITNVKFNTIDKTSEAENGGYGDYTGLTTSVARGQTYTLKVFNPPNHVIDPSCPEAIKAWIDWNHNGSFDDTGEAFEVANNLTTSQESPISITVPNYATLGTTRMRIVLWWDDTGNSNFPPNAGTFSCGEAEDYSINIVEPNAAPIITNLTPALSATNEDTMSSPLLISSFLEASDTDEPALKGIAITATTGNGTWQYSMDGTSWSALGSVSDSSALLLSSDYYIRYVPDGSNGETATITFRAWDQTSGTPGSKVNTTTNGGTTAFSANKGTATLVVTPVNDLPITADKTINVTEDLPYPFKKDDFPFTDIDLGDSLQAVRIDTLPLVGSLELNGSAVTAGTVINLADINNNKLTFIPANENTNFNFSVSDGSAWSSSVTTITIDVSARNDAPVITAPASITVTEDVPSPITGISFADEDAGVGVMTATFTVDSGTLSATSGGGVTVAGSGTAALTLTGNIANVNAFLAAENFIYTTANNISNPVTLTISANDNGNTGSGGAQQANTSITLVVTPDNDMPILSANTGFTVGEGGSHTLVNAELRCTDPDNTANQLTYTIVSGPVNGSLLLNGSSLTGYTFTQEDIDNGRLAYTHNGGETTSDSITFSVSDGAGGNIGNTILTITINLENDTPIIATNNPIAIDGGATVTIGPSQLAVTDSDHSPAQLIYTINTAPSHGTLNLGGSVISVGGTFTQADIDNKRITYTHDNSESATDNFTFSVADGAGGSVNGTYTISIEPKVINPGSSSLKVSTNAVPADGLATATITVVVKNINGNRLAGHTITLSQGGGNSIITPAQSVTDSNGEAEFTIKSNRAETVTYTARDETSSSDITQTIQVTFGAGIMANPTSGSAVEGGTMAYELALISQPTNDVTINLTCSGGLQAKPNSVIFSQANYNTAQQIILTALDNDIAEGPHSETVTHSVYSSDPCYNGYSLPDITVAITDNDTPGIVILPSGGSTVVTEGGPKDNYTMVLTTQPKEDVEISVNTGSQLNINPTHAIFTRSNWQVPQTFEVWAIDDNLYEGNHTDSVTHSVYSADADYHNYSLAPLTVQITDNDRSNNDSDSSGSNRDNTPQTESTSKQIDAASGGTVSNTQVSVEIPAGTLPADATASITTLTASQANEVVPAGLRLKLASEVYEITTTGTREFGDKTITIKINYDPARIIQGEQPVIHYYNETLGRWEKLTTEYAQENGKWYAITRVNHLTKFTVFGLTAETVAEKQHITLKIGQLQAEVNGEAYTLDAAPYVEQQTQRTLVPVRFISEALGANVNWDDSTKQVTIIDGGKLISLTLGYNRVMVDGQPKAIDCASVLLPSGRIYVPLRFVSETLGAQVDYDDIIRQITITKGLQLKGIPKRM